VTDPPRLTLVFDADDTLWDNNVHFNRVIEDYLDWLAHPTLSRSAIRGVLEDIERANADVHGYGSKVFLRGLHDTFAHLASRPATAEEAAAIDDLARRLSETNVQLFAEVSETLVQLGARHELRLLTKGDPGEQGRKIVASGVAEHFTSTHVVWEKDPATYAALAQELGLDPARTWMIGNSPKSDILPARAVGWGAVLVPYAHTWALEHAELPDDPQIRTVARFPDLLDHF
jgi:putative hydrolase of the HAD superfamily